MFVSTIWASGRSLASSAFTPPLTGYNVRSVLFPGMQFYPCMSLDVTTCLFIRLDHPFGTEVTCEMDYGFITCAFLVRHMLVSVFSGTGSDCAMAVVPVADKLAIMMTDIRFILY